MKIRLKIILATLIFALQESFSTSKRELICKTDIGNRSLGITVEEILCDPKQIAELKLTFDLLEQRCFVDIPCAEFGDRAYNKAKQTGLFYEASESCCGAFNGMGPNMY